MFAAGKTSSGLVAQTYVDDVFSTYLYTGNSTSGGTQTITNGIDLSTYGGMVWIKGRSAAADPILTDTVRGAGTSATASKVLSSNQTSAENIGGSAYDYVSAFASNGFNVTQGGASVARQAANYSNVIYAAWTFRKAAKFFDVVTYTGNGSNRTIAHSLGQVPGCIIVKRTDAAAAWQVYHRSLTNTDYLVLNTTAAAATGTTRWNSTTATATNFSLGTDTSVNANSGTYVAYLFSHDTATDGLIQCGSFTTDASGNATVNLGWEPQFVTLKASSAVGNWFMQDAMRNYITYNATNNPAYLIANTSAAETTGAGLTNPIATGFQMVSGPTSTTYIYLAIRRPNKPPTSGTQVFLPLAYTGTGAARSITSVGWPTDFLISSSRSGYGGLGWGFWDRLRGTNGTSNRTLVPPGTGAEQSGGQADISSFDQLGVSYGDSVGWGLANTSAVNYVEYFFRRAPGVFDEVCYTGTGSNTTQAHNLGVVPELMIVKRRGTTGAWSVYSAGLSNTEYLVLNTTAAKATGTTYWNSTTPTSTVFSLGTAADVNASSASNTYVAWLFASAAGISKVFSYTGNGSSQTINCGFSGGARFVLIKRTDSTGDWYVWDSARGIVAGNDPHLSLNSTAAEVTTDDSVDADSTGFIVNQLSATNINVTSATYIGLAFA